MATKFFKLMATDGCKSFEATGQWNGVWFGVAKVVDDAEIERLTKRGCTEITEEQYNSEVKKKAAQRSALDDYRQILAVPDAQLVAKAQPESSPKPPAEPPPVEQVVKAAPVPRRKSVVAP